MWSQSKTYLKGPSVLWEKFSQIKTDWHFRRIYNALVCAQFKKKEQQFIEEIKIYIFQNILHVISAKVPAVYSNLGSRPSTTGSSLMLLHTGLKSQINLLILIIIFLRQVNLYVTNCLSIEYPLFWMENFINVN